jgi:hypothetical protein
MGTKAAIAGLCCFAGLLQARPAIAGETAGWTAAGVHPNYLLTGI